MEINIPSFQVLIIRVRFLSKDKLFVWIFRTFKNQIFFLLEWKLKAWVITTGSFDSPCIFIKRNCKSTQTRAETLTFKHLYDHELSLSPSLAFVCLSLSLYPFFCLPLSLPFFCLSRFLFFLSLSLFLSFICLCVSISFLFCL